MTFIDYALLFSLAAGITWAIFTPEEERNPILFRTFAVILTVSSALVLGSRLMV